MLRGLACQFPQMRTALELLNETVESPGRSLADFIYPKTAFTDEERRASELELRDTRIAQPALGAVTLGILRILHDFGVRADMAGGHSFGELAALHASGRIDDRSLLRLAERRGALMAECGGPTARERCLRSLERSTR